MDPLDRWRRQARELRGRTLHPTRVEPVDLGVPASLHLPDGDGPWPAVWLVPGALDGKSALERYRCVLTAPRLAREGFACLVYTPSGREGTPGREDHGGPIHRAEGAAALRALYADPRVASVSVVSISFGLFIACGTLVSHPELAERVRVYIDWEGPGSVRWLVPRGDWEGDAAYWAAREPVRLIGQLRCPYRRMQSDRDHVHGAQVEIGLEMARAGPPGTRLNDSVVPFSDVFWAPRRQSDQGDQLVDWLNAAADRAPPPRR